MGRNVIIICDIKKIIIKKRERKGMERKKKKCDGLGLEEFYVNFWSYKGFW